MAYFKRSQDCAQRLASAAAFNVVQAHPSNSGYYAGDPFEPYVVAVWFSFASAAASLLLLPWVTVI